MKKVKVVTVGAGTGQATLLTALCSYHHLIDITAIVSVSDNGGHSGLLREMYHIPQVGDGRQCLLALSPGGEKKLLYEKRSDDGHSVGNEVLAELTLQYGSIARAFEILGHKVNSLGQVLPVTTEYVDIAARLQDGNHVVGEWQIIDRKSRLPIDELYLVPKVEAYAGSIMAVQEADYIIIAPGSLRTGIISCLLAQGMCQAVRSTPAIVIFVVNLMTQPGQTDDFSAQDHLNEFARYAGRYPDFAILNHGPIPQYLIEHYASIGSEPIRGSITVPKVRALCGDFTPAANNYRAREERIGAFKKWTHLLVHDGRVLANTIIDIINGRST